MFLYLREWIRRKHKLKCKLKYNSSIRKRAEIKEWISDQAVHIRLAEEAAQMEAINHHQVE